MSIGLPELLILFGIFLALVLPTWGVIDAAIRPDSAWLAAGQNKLSYTPTARPTSERLKREREGR